MNDVKWYNWANVILIPVWLVFLGTGSANEGAGLTIGIIGYVGVLISSLLNDNLRGSVLGFVSNMLKGLLAAGCFGAPFALLAATIFFCIAGTLGMFFVIFYLWFTSLFALFKGR